MNDRRPEGGSRSSRWAWLVTLLLAGNVRPAEPAYTPEQEQSAFKLAEGYEAHLFASEADGVIKPIQMRFDPEGRLWIACSTIYPQIKPGETPNDKIIVIEDTNGDGRADKSTVFADGLMIPTGLEFGDGGLYVGNGTQLLHLADTDGDGRADQRRVVLRGFGTGDSHQNINSFCWSPGGQLFMSQGLHAFSDVETPHGIERLHQAGIWRFTPRELRLEPFFGNGVTPQNPWGFVWDDWATPFMVAGNGDGIYWLSPALVRTTHRRDVQRIFNPGNKYCGVDIVGTKHLPPALQGKLIAGGFMNNRIVVFRFEDQGSGFVLKEEAPLLVSSDVSFRPVDVKVGPDGAIYVADWCNPIIGHYQASFRDPRRDKAHGRIWRITAKGRPLVPRAKLAGATEGELLDQLKSGERWPRYQARRVLAQRKPFEVQSALDRWIKSLDASHPSYDRNLVEGLGVYEMFDLVEPNLLAQLLSAKDPRARAYATEVLGRWSARVKDPLTLLAKQAADEHPRVRLQAVVAASRIPDERSIEIALSAVDRPVDRFIEDALVQTVFALKEQWLPGFIAGRLNFAEKGNRLEYLLKTDGSTDTLRATADRLKNAGLNRDTKASLLGVLANVGGPTELAMVLDSRKYVDRNGSYDPEFQSRLLPQLGSTYELRKIKPAGDLNGAIAPMIGSSNAALRAEALKLAGKWNLQTYRGQFESIIDATIEPLPVRMAAVEALATLGTPNEPSTLVTLRKTSGPPYPKALRITAVIAEIPLDAHAAAADAATLLAEPLEDSLVEQLVGAFLLRQKAVDQLSDALKVRKPTTDAARIGLRRMSATGQANQKLQNVFIESAGLRRETRQFDPTEIALLADEVREQGHGGRGGEIYARTELNCSACHTISGKGGNIGPDLSALGTAQPVEFIIGAILYPNREVKEGFMAIEVETKSGETHQGYVLRENNDELVLRDVTAGQEIRLAKREIASHQQRGSVMPEGLADTLTRSEFRDLVRFLSELGR